MSTPPPAPVARKRLGLLRAWLHATVLSDVLFLAALAFLSETDRPARDWAALAVLLFLPALLLGLLCAVVSTRMPDRVARVPVLLIPLLTTGFAVLLSGWLAEQSAELGATVGVIVAEKAWPMTKFILAELSWENFPLGACRA